MMPDEDTRRKAFPLMIQGEVGQGAQNPMLLKAEGGPVERPGNDHIPLATPVHAFEPELDQPAPGVLHPVVARF